MSATTRSAGQNGGMLTNLPMRVLLAGAGLIAVGVVAMVVLILNGHGNQVIEIPIVVGALVPIVYGQTHIAHQVHEVKDKTDQLLNGVTEAAVERAIDRKLTPVGALSNPDVLRAVVAVIRPDNEQHTLEPDDTDTGEPNG